MSPVEKKQVAILYTNWKGETAARRIIPIAVWFGHTEWHEQDQWLLKALDVDKDTERDFAMKDIKKWGSDESSKKY